jgi:hypothetical protein
MHARGDRAEALKWLRRAAEAASANQADRRAVELAKAAADLASNVRVPQAPSPVPARSPATKTLGQTPRAPAFAKTAPLPARSESRGAPAQRAERRPQLLIDDDDDFEEPDEKTRVGVPAYQTAAQAATRPAVAHAEDVEPRPAQAIRVVVWRTADGVHIAPVGTRVAAISVDAILVALDPSADLAAWLSGK